MAKSTEQKMSKAQRKAASKGGRKRKEGERYPSGKLKPQGPNPIIIARRQALCDDLTKATCPIDVMLSNRWISEDQHRIAAAYRHDHARAGLGGPVVPAQRDLSAPAGVDARGLSFATMTAKEVAAIWDSAMNRMPTAGNGQNTGSASAMRRYKAANQAMTVEQRNEVNGVVLLDSWPQWVIQRRAGRFDTSWERKRDLLVGGLDAVAGVYGPSCRAA